MTDKKGLQAKLEISPIQHEKGQGFNIHAKFHVLHTQKNNEESGMVAFYIPAFDIYYSAPTKEEGVRRSRIMVKAFLNFWCSKQGWKKFISEILKLGFRADPMTNKRLATGEPLKGKANMMVPTKSLVPKDFENAESIEQQLEAVM